MGNNDYILITAARNEESYIERTIQSVVSQRIRPLRWLIVSDASIDATDHIVIEYSKTYDFIKLIRREKSEKRDFRSKVFALQEGLKNVASISYSFIGNLDADVSFDEFYYENIINKFKENEKLGIAGGSIYEEYHGKYKSRPTNTIRSVAGAIQFFSRECFEATGGYIPLESGGEDWVMEINAKMRGWQIESFRDLIVFHHKKPGNNLSQVIKRRFNEGCMDFSVGSHPIFEVFKCTQRLTHKPYLIGGIIRLFGFYSSYLLRRHRMVSDDFIAFLRREQMNRLGSMFLIR